MAESYDLRSNLKNKPGSQGTLFQVKDKGLLNPQQRWPRGYTPERLNDVRGALSRTMIDPPAHLSPEFNPDYDSAPHGHVQYEPGDYSGEMGYRDKHVVRAIAKSTVPVRDLEGLKAIHARPDEDDHGTYWPQRKEIGIDMTAGPDMDRTLIHEIGHHAENDGTTSMGSYRAFQEIQRVGEKHAWQDKSKYVERPTRSGQVLAENKVQAGVHEALADSYMVEHYRTGGRKSSPVTEGQYERNFTSDSRDRHYPGYNDVRTPLPSPTLQRLQFNEAQGKLF